MWKMLKYWIWFKQSWCHREIWRLQYRFKCVSQIKLLMLQTVSIHTLSWVTLSCYFTNSKQSQNFITFWYLWILLCYCQCSYIVHCTGIVHVHFITILLNICVLNGIIEKWQMWNLSAQPWPGLSQKLKESCRPADGLGFFHYWSPYIMTKCFG